MKTAILVFAMIASTSVFAKGSDKTYTCRVKGVNSSGATVRYTSKYGGGLGRAFQAAIRDCKRSGLTKCRANCSY